MKTNMGDLSIQLFCNLAPKACENFLELAQKGFYNDMKFHRLVTDFII
jgi:peptidyl-prolyl cis-trans isomerase B (cyclophilin B)